MADKRLPEDKDSAVRQGNRTPQEYHRLRRRRGTIYVVIGLVIGAANMLLQQVTDSAPVLLVGSIVLGVYLLAGAGYVLFYDKINRFLGWNNE